MSLLIVGTGALACLFAARLAQAGYEITMLGSWPDGLVALQQEGVTVHDLEGNAHSFRVRVVDTATITGAEKFSQALVLVKSWQTERVAKQLTSCLSADGVALTLQNGLGNDEILIRELSRERVAFGVTMVGARMLQPGHVQFTGDGKVFLGSHPKLSGLASMLRKAGFQVEMVSDTTSLLWGKLVINAAINPLTALLRVPNGELLERACARELLGVAAQEAASVAREHRISLPYPDPVKAVENVAHNTAANFSSMLQDVLRGAITEIDSINGAIVRLGEQAGLPTPINRVLWQLVRSLDHH